MSMLFQRSRIGQGTRGHKAAQQGPPAYGGLNSTVYIGNF